MRVESRRAADEGALPSPLADRLGGLCAVLAACLAVLWSLRPLAHDDLFWHLRTADWIFEHRSVPTADPFSFTRLGAPWISHEWGFALLAGMWNRAFGLRGLLILTAVIVLSAGVLVARRAAAPAARLQWGAGGPLFAIALLACGSVLFLRASLLAVLLLAAFLLALDRWRRSGRRVFLAAAVAILWLWANVHSDVVFGLALLALQLAEAWTARWLASRAESPIQARNAAARWLAAADRPGAAKELAWALLAGAGLSLCNPNGLRSLLYPWILRRVLWGSGIAWDLGEFAAPSPLSNLPLVLLALLLVLALLRGRSRVGTPAEVLAGIGAVMLAFSASRFALECAVIVLPLLMRGLAPITPEHPRVVSLASLALALMLSLTVWRFLPEWPLRAVSPGFPEGAVRFLRAEKLEGRPFHNSNQGGYLLWSLARPTFWDGRSEVFASLTREVTTTPFPEIVSRYGVDLLVLTEREMRDLRGEAEGGRWGLVYWDDASAVYLRRDGPLGGALSRLELVQFRALTDGSELPGIAEDPVRRAAARAELERLIAEQPANRRALYFAAVLDLAGGDAARATTLLRAALALGENDAVRRALALAEGAVGQPLGGGR